MRSVMKHAFSEVPRATIPRSSFDRSHGLKTCINVDYLYPFFVDEALPGDTFNLRTAAFARLSTPIYPIMDNMFVDTFYFAVPYRLVWDNFVKMMGERNNPNDSIDFSVPQVTPVNTFPFQEDSLADYFGLPTNIPNLSVSALPFRAYNLIYDTWFRDQNLQNQPFLTTGDATVDDSQYILRRRGKRHDYFTSALPWPQKGDAVTLPLGTTAPVTAGSADHGIVSPSNMRFYQANTSNPAGTGKLHLTTGSLVLDNSAPNPAQYSLNPSNLYADLSTAAAATINSLRQAFQVQELLERDARSGTRYFEILVSHFGVFDPGHAVLQRPVYLGGGSTPVNVTPIAQTTNTAAVAPDTGRPLGSLAAIGTASFNNHGFTKSFTEHCIIIGLVNVRADLTYQQGIDRMWSRKDRYDFYWPSLAQLGEQAILNKEINAKGDFGDDLVFGYQERYAEYRYKPSTIHSRFRSNSAASLDAWHLSQDFGPTVPVLGDNFISARTPLDRCVAVNTEPQFILDVYHKLICARPMPLYGVPASLSRF